MAPTCAIHCATTNPPAGHGTTPPLLFITPQLIAGHRNGKHPRDKDSIGRDSVGLYLPELHHIAFVEFPESVVAQLMVPGAQPDEEAVVTIFKDERHRFYFALEAVPGNIQAFAILLVSSIVRGFWVLEKRERQKR